MYVNVVDFRERYNSGVNSFNRSGEMEVDNSEVEGSVLDEEISSSDNIDLVLAKSSTKMVMKGSYEPFKKPTLISAIDKSGYPENIRDDVELLLSFLNNFLGLTVNTLPL